VIILDTNVLSEVIKEAPSNRVMDWLARHSSSELFTTSITQAEVLCGLELLPAGRKRTTLEVAVERIFAQAFEGRILPFDSGAAAAFSKIAAARQAAGRPATDFDIQIAAIAVVHGAAVATRNTRDFEGCGISVLNPWGSNAPSGRSA